MLHGAQSKIDYVLESKLLKLNCWDQQLDQPNTHNLGYFMY